MDLIPVEAWLFVRGALAASFLLAGLAKLSDGEAFARSLEGLGLPPTWVSIWLARLVSSVELLLAGALYSGVGGASSLFAAVAVLAVFTAVLAYVLVRGQKLVCGCFGTARIAPVSSADIARNMFLIAASVAVAVAGGHATSWPVSGTERLGAEGAFPMVTATVGVLLLVNARALTGLFQKPPGADVAPGRIDR